MSIQRLDVFTQAGVNEPYTIHVLDSDEGRFVLYADHVEALIKVEDQAVAAVNSMVLEIIAAVEDTPDFWASGPWITRDQKVCVTKSSILDMLRDMLPDSAQP